MRFVLNVVLKLGQTGPELADDLEHVIKVLRVADWPLHDGEIGYIRRHGEYLPESEGGWKVVGP